ncbi:MAG: ABC transporter permease [Muribaculaceae bacterium]|nr:ABC transporter permease [Muribaculaceae bacterium]MBR5118129.1 ABC transporter permease [Muribaculaceae bacterium]
MKNQFLQFVKKETLHILRDSRTMLIALLMPVAQILLFGFAVSTEINNINVAVVVPQWCEGVRQSVERLSANPYITYKGDIAPDEIDQNLRSGNVDAIVVFTHDFEKIMNEWRRNGVSKSAMQFIMDASNTNIAQAGTGYLTNILASDVMAASSMVETHMLFNPQLKSAFNFVPGIMGMIFILICALLTSVSIVREKETGTMDVLLVSPVRPLRIILAKMVPYFGLSCINLTTILLLARFVLGIPMGSNLWIVILVSLVYLALALSLGLLVSTIAKKQVVALLISAAVMLLPIVMLSGMLFPIENMPSVLQPLSAIVPARWYIDAMRKLLIQGASFPLILKDFLILIIMTILLLAVALKKFNDKLE